MTGFKVMITFDKNAGKQLHPVGLSKAIDQLVGTVRVIWARYVYKRGNDLQNSHRGEGVLLEVFIMRAHS